MNILIEAILGCLLFFLLQIPISNVYVLLFTFGVLKKIIVKAIDCKKLPSLGQTLFEGAFYLTSVYVLPSSLHLQLAYIFTTSVTFRLFVDYFGLQNKC